MKALIGALAVTTVFAAAPAVAASDYLLEIEGIKGESTSTVRPGAIDVMSWSWGLSITTSPAAGGGVGKVSLQDFNWVQPVDSTAPRLLNWSLETIPSLRDVTLYALRTASNGTRYSFFEIAFPNSGMSSLMLGGSSGAGDIAMSLTVAVPTATMLYRQSPGAAPVTGSFSIVDDKLSFTGDALVLQGYVEAMTAVPEPTTWSLMLGGVGLVGAAALRRRRSA